MVTIEPRGHCAHRSNRYCHEGVPWDHGGRGREERWQLLGSQRGPANLSLCGQDLREDHWHVASQAPCRMKVKSFCIILMLCLHDTAPLDVFVHRI